MRPAVDVRRLVPYALLPLSLIACALASAPWLRAFPSAVLAVPLFGAAALSLLVPLLVVGIGVRRLAVSALVDLALLVSYELLVALREPAGFGNLVRGLVHGPAQILSFALPLVSPRTLLVAPVALCWLCGALIGECVARGWQTVLPYVALLATFGLAYAGTARAVTSSADGRRYDTLLAGGLLLALLLLRTAQAWVMQDEVAEATQSDGVLPLRSVAVGAVVSVLIAAAAAAAVQAPAFAGRAVTPARVPPLDQSRPLTPIAFVGGLRPSDPASKGRPLFTVSTASPVPNYVALASVDYYDGDSWSFSRTFRPSGGVIPADPDPGMRTPGAEVTQQYAIAPGALTSVPWLPHLDRVDAVTGVPIDIDSASGMVVPAHQLRSGDEYTVRSSVPRRTFLQLGPDALLGTSAAQVDTTLANGLAGPLATLIASLAQETGVSSARPVAFLQAVVRDFRSNAGLAGAAPAAPGSDTPSTSGATSPSPTASPHTGGTTFADVLASIRGTRAGTPEQFATLTALIARRLGIPARLVAGFRIPAPRGGQELPAGTYRVTSADAWTWAEIPIRGAGWLVLDAAPGTYAAQRPPTVGTSASPAPSPSPAQNAQLTHSNNGGHAVAPSSETPHSRGLSAVALAVIVIASVVLVVAGLLALLVARKHVRGRRRRAHADPRHRLLGAWQESIDVLAEAGLPDLTSATSSEIASRTAARFGAEPAAHARELGAAADGAIFRPSAPVSVLDADGAWRAHAALTRSVRRRLGLRDRVRARLRYNRPRRR